MVKNVSVVIPAYNEEKGIVNVLDDLSSLFSGLDVEKYEIIVVNDGSSDKTAEIVSGYDKGVKLIEHARNKGYGASLKTGIRSAEHETVVVVDADSTYPIDEIPRLLEEMDNADMVVGARIGKEVNIETVRKPAKWFLTRLASFLSGTEIPDLNSGLRAFNRDLAMEYFHLLPNKFSFTTTITLALISDNYEVRYVPINYYGRKGQSKIIPLDAWNFFVLIIKTVLYFNPLKVMIPVSAFFGLIGLGKLYYDLFILSDLTDSSVFLILFAFQLFALGVIADLIVKRT